MAFPERSLSTAANAAQHVSVLEISHQIWERQEFKLGLRCIGYIVGGTKLNNKLKAAAFVHADNCHFNCVSL